MKYDQLLISRAANGFTIIAVGNKKGDTVSYIASDVKGVTSIVEEALNEYEDPPFPNPKGDNAPWSGNFGPSSFS